MGKKTKGHGNPYVSESFGEAVEGVLGEMLGAVLPESDDPEHLQAKAERDAAFEAKRAERHAELDKQRAPSRRLREKMREKYSSPKSSNTTASTLPTGALERIATVFTSGLNQSAPTSAGAHAELQELQDMQLAFRALESAPNDEQAQREALVQQGIFLTWLTNLNANRIAALESILADEQSLSEVQAAAALLARFNDEALEQDLQSYHNRHNQALFTHIKQELAELKGIAQRLHTSSSRMSDIRQAMGQLDLARDEAGQIYSRRKQNLVQLQASLQQAKTEAESASSDISTHVTDYRVHARDSHPKRSARPLPAGFLKHRLVHIAEKRATLQAQRQRWKAAFKEHQPNLFGHWVLSLFGCGHLSDYAKAKAEKQQVLQKFDEATHDLREQEQAMYQMLAEQFHTQLVSKDVDDQNAFNYLVNRTSREPELGQFRILNLDIRHKSVFLDFLAKEIERTQASLKASARTPWQLLTDFALEPGIKAQKKQQKARLKELHQLQRELLAVQDNPLLNLSLHDQFRHDLSAKLFPRGDATLQIQQTAGTVLTQQECYDLLMNAFLQPADASYDNTFKSSAQILSAIQELIGQQPAPRGKNKRPQQQYTDFLRSAQTTLQRYEGKPDLVKALSLYANIVEDGETSTPTPTIRQQIFRQYNQENSQPEQNIKPAISTIQRFGQSFDILCNIVIKAPDDNITTDEKSKQAAIVFGQDVVIKQFMHYFKIQLSTEAQSAWRNFFGDSLTYQEQAPLLTHNGDLNPHGIKFMTGFKKPVQDDEVAIKTWEDMRPDYRAFFRFMIQQIGQPNGVPEACRPFIENCLKATDPQRPTERALVTEHQQTLANDVTTILLDAGDSESAIELTIHTIKAAIQVESALVVGCDLVEMQEKPTCDNVPGNSVKAYVLFGDEIFFVHRALGTCDNLSEKISNTKVIAEAIRERFEPTYEAQVLSSDDVKDISDSLNHSLPVAKSRGIIETVSQYLDSRESGKLTVSREKLYALELSVALIEGKTEFYAYGDRSKKLPLAELTTDADVRRCFEHILPQSRMLNRDNGTNACQYLITKYVEAYQITQLQKKYRSTQARSVTLASIAADLSTFMTDRRHFQTYLSASLPGRQAQIRAESDDGINALIRLVNKPNGGERSLTEVDDDVTELTARALHCQYNVTKTRRTVDVYLYGSMQPHLEEQGLSKDEIKTVIEIGHLIYADAFPTISFDTETLRAEARTAAVSSRIQVILDDLHRHGISLGDKRQTLEDKLTIQLNLEFDMASGNSVSTLTKRLIDARRQTMTVIVSQINTDWVTYLSKIHESERPFTAFNGQSARYAVLLQVFGTQEQQAFWAKQRFGYLLTHTSTVPLIQADDKNFFGAYLPLPETDAAALTVTRQKTPAELEMAQLKAAIAKEVNDTTLAQALDPNVSWNEIIANTLVTPYCSVKVQQFYAIKRLMEFVNTPSYSRELDTEALAFLNGIRSVATDPVRSLLFDNVKSTDVSNYLNSQFADWLAKLKIELDKTPPESPSLQWQDFIEYFYASLGSTEVVEDLRLTQMGYLLLNKVGGDRKADIARYCQLIKAVDVDYFGKNVEPRLCHDDSNQQRVVDIVQRYMVTFNGQSMEAAPFFMLLRDINPLSTKPDFQTDLNRWLDKRLTNLLTPEATVAHFNDDMPFLEHFLLNPNVNQDGLNQTLNAKLYQYISDPTITWNQDFQDKIIDKFASSENRQLYRIKRLGELVRADIRVGYTDEQTARQHVLSDTMKAYLAALVAPQFSDRASVELSNDELQSALSSTAIFDLNNANVRQAFGRMFDVVLTDLQAAGLHEAWSFTAEFIFTIFAKGDLIAKLGDLRLNKLQAILTNYCAMPVIKPQNDTQNYLSASTYAAWLRGNDATAAMHLDAQAQRRTRIVANYVASAQCADSCEIVPLSLLNDITLKTVSDEGVAGKKVVAIITATEKQAWLDHRFNKLFAQSHVDLSQGFDVDHQFFSHIRQYPVLETHFNRVLIPSYINNTAFVWDEATHDSFMARHAIRENQDAYLIKSIKARLDLIEQIEDMSTAMSAGDASFIAKYLEGNDSQFKLLPRSGFSQIGAQNLDVAISSYLDTVAAKSKTTRWNLACEQFLARLVQTGSEPTLLDTKHLEKLQALAIEDLLFTSPATVIAGKHRFELAQHYVTEWMQQKTLEANGLLVTHFKSESGKIAIKAVFDGYSAAFKDDLLSRLNEAYVLESHAEYLFSLCAQDDQVDAFRLLQVTELLQRNNIEDTHSYVNCLGDLLAQTSRKGVSTKTIPAMLTNLGEDALDKLFRSYIAQEVEWSPNTQKLIYMFGSDECLDHYHVKRLQQLLERDNLLEAEQFVRQLRQLGIDNLVKTQAGKAELDKVFESYLGDDKRCRSVLSALIRQRYSESEHFTGEDPARLLKQYNLKRAKELLTGSPYFEPPMKDFVPEKEQVLKQDRDESGYWQGDAKGGNPGKWTLKQVVDRFGNTASALTTLYQALNRFVEDFDPADAKKHGAETIQFARFILSEGAWLDSLPLELQTAAKAMVAMWQTKFQQWSLRNGGLALLKEFGASIKASAYEHAKKGYIKVHNRSDVDRSAVSETYEQESLRSLADKVADLSNLSTIMKEFRTFANKLLATSDMQYSPTTLSSWITDAHYLYRHLPSDVMSELGEGIAYLQELADKRAHFSRQHLPSVNPTWQRSVPELGFCVDMLRQGIAAHRPEQRPSDASTASKAIWFEDMTANLMAYDAALTSSASDVATFKSTAKNLVLTIDMLSRRYVTKRLKDAIMDSSRASDETLAAVRNAFKVALMYVPQRGTASSSSSSQIQAADAIRQIKKQLQSIAGVFFPYLSQSLPSSLVEKLQEQFSEHLNQEGDKGTDFMRQLLKLLQPLYLNEATSLSAWFLALFEAFKPFMEAEFTTQTNQSLAEIEKSRTIADIRKQVNHVNTACELLNIQRRFVSVVQIAQDEVDAMVNKPLEIACEELLPYVGGLQKLAKDYEIWLEQFAVICGDESVASSSHSQAPVMDNKRQGIEAILRRLESEQREAIITQLEQLRKPATAYDATTCQDVFKFVCENYTALVELYGPFESAYFANHYAKLNELAVVLQTQLVDIDADKTQARFFNLAPDDCEILAHCLDDRRRQEFLATLRRLDRRSDLHPVTKDVVSALIPTLAKKLLSESDRATLALCRERKPLHETLASIASKALITTSVAKINNLLGHIVSESSEQSWVQAFASIEAKVSARDSRQEASNLSEFYRYQVYQDVILVLHDFLINPSVVYTQVHVDKLASVVKGEAEDILAAKSLLQALICEVLEKRQDDGAVYSFLEPLIAIVGSPTQKEVIVSRKDREHIEAKQAELAQALSMQASSSRDSSTDTLDLTDLLSDLFHALSLLSSQGDSALSQMRELVLKTRATVAGRLSSDASNQLMKSSVTYVAENLVRGTLTEEQLICLFDLFKGPYASGKSFAHNALVFLSKLSSHLFLTSKDMSDASRRALDNLKVAVADLILKDASLVNSSEFQSLAGQLGFTFNPVELPEVTAVLFVKFLQKTPNNDYTAQQLKLKIDARLDNVVQTVSHLSEFVPSTDILVALTFGNNELIQCVISGLVEQLKWFNAPLPGKESTPTDAVAYYFASRQRAFSYPEVNGQRHASWYHLAHILSHVEHLVCPSRIYPSRKEGILYPYMPETLKSMNSGKSVQTWSYIKEQLSSKAMASFKKTIGTLDKQRATLIQQLSSAVNQTRCSDFLVVHKFATDRGANPSTYSNAEPETQKTLFDFVSNLMKLYRPLLLGSALTPKDYQQTLKLLDAFEARLNKLAPAPVHVDGVRVARSSSSSSVSDSLVRPIWPSRSDSMPEMSDMRRPCETDPPITTSGNSWINSMNAAINPAGAGVSSSKEEVTADTIAAVNSARAAGFSSL